MTTEVSTKVVKVDFKEIIDNCLDRKFWEKKWLIFEYDDFEISIRLYKIDVNHGSVDLIMRAENSEQNISDYSLFWLPLDHYNENVFRKKLLSTAHYLIKKIERTLARRTSRYEELAKEAQELREQNKLELERYLDENGVKNEDIREAYIKQNNETFDTTSEYVDSWENNHLQHVHNMIDVMIEFEGEE
ncbi:hypothetical protein E4P35_12100, partial [Thiopseudomonas sp. 4R-3cl]